MPAESSSDTPLIQSLLRPECYRHPVDRVRLRETHISWIFLTGAYAYKVKKPVDFGFLNFSTLEMRLHYCEEEVRLNRRLAASLYIDVVPITGALETPKVGGQGVPMEYAVRMYEFSDADLASVMAQSGGLTEQHLDDLALCMARFHQQIPRSCRAHRRGGSACAKQAVEENFGLLKERCMDSAVLEQLGQIESWMDVQFNEDAALMDRRSEGGSVRECHGDLHLGNLVLLAGRLTPFDCIEFSEELRWVDVMSEIAFLVMDLEIHGLSHLGWRFLNRYLEATGDYGGLPLLRYFLVYRALVRAKIALLSAASRISEAEGDRQFRRYVEYGSRVIRDQAPVLMIMHGYSGSGKSLLAGLISEGLPAIRLRSDVERKRIGPAAGSPAERYGPDQTRATYDHLRQLAVTLLKAGFSVVVDATFLAQPYRERMKETAAGLGVSFLIVDVQTPVAIMRRRIETRCSIRSDPSEADLRVLERQLQTHEPLSQEEVADTWAVSGDSPFDRQSLISGVRLRLGGNRASGG
jgi:aminoglycoside phosphotransferase family enzyme/predicted kinase